MTHAIQIDDSLYSRQRYVLGDDGMHRMATAKVFLHGLGGVGIEVAKNLCLAGVQSLTIQDETPARLEDLSCQFFLRAEDVELGRTRAEASLPRLAELNPYVKVERLPGSISSSGDMSVLESYQCVVLTDYDLELVRSCDEFCRSRHIRLVVVGVWGLFGCLFCDFGPEHEVRDVTGEESREVLVGDITRANPGVVTSLDDALHGLETGDSVTFREVRGMSEVNGCTFRVKVLSPTSFSIDDTSHFSAFESGGVATEVKIPKKFVHRSFSEEMTKPTMEPPDLGRMAAPSELHLAHLTLLHTLLKTDQARREFYSCKPNLPTDLIMNEAQRINAELGILDPEEVDRSLLLGLLSCGSGGAALPPLCAFFGGVAAQEALKAVTAKFSPLSQWLYLDARELMPREGGEPSANGSAAWTRRYAPLRQCLGDEVLLRTMAQRLFLVGCGAIGCELLKNFALLGVGCKRLGGSLVVTDNDIIEKSNLNRQFLFRERHIRHPKAKVAAAATKDINADLELVAHVEKVCEASESTHFSNAFFESCDIVVNALDNVQSRLYMDARCVTNQRPLLESGTMGTKGHVQVIVPHLSETYASQADPPEREIPYCTLKSFPSNLEHCIQWARDKFESQFSLKPFVLGKFLDEEGARGAAGSEALVQRLCAGQAVENAVQSGRFLRSKPASWPACVRLARDKFEKYFSHKAKQLLHTFPLDCRLQDGTPFWQPPKRPPTPIAFDPAEETHMGFLRSCARLLATVGGISYSPEDLELRRLLAHLEGHSVIPFTPADKYIETDSKMTREAAEERKKAARNSVGLDDAELLALRAFEAAGKRCRSPQEPLWTALPQPFEKDCEEHIDFVTAAANLRGAMYALEPADRFRVKRIAGRIVPAIATTTAAVAGLVTLELLKLVTAQLRNQADQADSLTRYRNAFLNLALPVFLLSEPGPCPRHSLKDGVSFSIWDRWVMRVPPSCTVADFLKKFEAEFKMAPYSVMQDSKMVFFPFLPVHAKRLKKPILEFLRCPESKQYADLLVTTEKGMEIGDDDDDDDDDRMTECPTLRLFFTT